MEELEKAKRMERERRRHVYLPVFKTWDEVKEYIVRYNKSDFNVDCEYWHGPPPAPPSHVITIKSFGNAATYSDEGYYVFANNVDELGPYISHLVNEALSKNIPIIYIRVSITGMTLSSEVDIQLMYTYNHGVDV